MKIINIYRDKIDVMWQDSATFLCVFDESNSLIADYDFCTGLKLMQDGKDIIVYINDEDLIEGKWVFLGTKMNQSRIPEKVRVEGFKHGDPLLRVFDQEYPWDKRCGPGDYVSRGERENRLSICKSCPFFDSENMTCSVNNKIVLQSTKYEFEYCPHENWGDKEKVEKYLLDHRLGDILEPSGPSITQEDQEEFEKEFDAFLEGLQ